jgi:iron complex outermembrane receptor protein
MFLGTGSAADLSGDVYAAFGELSVPFTDKIQMQLAARYEDYGGQTGSTFNPKAAIRWQVTDWLAFRGSAGSTFRGPPLTQLVTSSVTALSFIAGSFRAIDIFGNPSLAPEKANTYSVGAIVNLGRFKGTVDWWRFDFSNPIVAEPSGAMVATMFPANSPVNCGNPAFAGLQARFTFQGACGVSAISRVRTLYVNGPSVETSGVDVQGDYDFGDFLDGRLKFGGGLTYTIDYKTDAFTVGGVSVQPAYDAAGLLNYQLSATSLPQLKGQVYIEYTNGPHNLRWTTKYIGDYHDQRADVAGAGIVAVNPVSGQVISRGSTIAASWTHNVDYRLLLPQETTLTIGIENLFDQDPSFARLDLNYDPFTGDPLGRTIKVGLKKKF